MNELSIFKHYPAEKLENHELLTKGYKGQRVVTFFMMRRQKDGKFIDSECPCSEE